MPHNKNLQTRPPHGPDDDDRRCNVVHARVGRWQANFQWRPLPNRTAIETKVVGPKRHRLTTVLVLLVFFALGAVVALGMAWDLVPYIETTRVVSELTRLKLGGSLCLIGGLLLFLARKFFHS